MPVYPDTAKARSRKECRATRFSSQPNPAVRTSPQRGSLNTMTSGVLPRKCREHVVVAMSRCSSFRKTLIGRRSDVDAQRIAQQPKWSSLQENLKLLSPHSRRIIAKSSGHHVAVDRPDVVITGIQNKVMLLRNNVADSGEGTTRVQ